jgi:ubiquinone/menaquinone biosynthesis C-methylase UbiE
VLDLGCGVGDLSVLVARMVGESGAVLGIDRAARCASRYKHGGEMRLMLPRV